MFSHRQYNNNDHKICPSAFDRYYIFVFQIHTSPRHQVHLYGSDERIFGYRCSTEFLNLNVTANSVSMTRTEPAVFPAPTNQWGRFAFN